MFDDLAAVLAADLAHVDACVCLAAGWRFRTVTLLGIGHRYIQGLQDVLVCALWTWREPRCFCAGEEVRLRHCYAIRCKTWLFDDAGEAQSAEFHRRACDIRKENGAS